MQVIVHFCQIQSSLVHKREKFLMTLEIVHIRHTHTNRAAMPEICNCTGTFSWKFGCYPCMLTKCSTRETKCTSLRSWQNNYLKLLSNFCYFYVTIDRHWNCQPTSEKYCKRCFEWTHLIYMVQFNGKLGPTLCRPVPNVHNFRSSAHNLCPTVPPDQGCNVSKIACLLFIQIYNLMLPWYPQKTTKYYWALKSKPRNF